MRYRDQPIIEVTQRVRCDTRTAWELVTDIGLPAHCSSELRAAEWLDDAKAVEVGARFRGRNAH
ncbi:MAG: SRPBCC family protein, partial [Mycobacterium sp.]